MKRYVKSIVIFLICIISVTFGMFMLNRAANGVTIEYSQLPKPERKIVNMLDEVYADVVVNKSYRLRRGSYYVIMRFGTNRTNRSGDKINLSGMIVRQINGKLTDDQLKAEELQQRRDL